MFYNTTLIVLQKIHPDFWGFKWVLKALSPGFIPKLDAIKIQQNQVIGTDSHRLHIYYTKNKFPPGIFKVLSKQRSKLILEKVTNTNFPKWEHLLPKKQEIEKEFNLTTINSRGYTELIRQMDKNVTLDFNFFMDLDSSMEKVSITKNLLTGKQGAVFFRNPDESQKALIMPIKMLVLEM